MCICEGESNGWLRTSISGNDWGLPIFFKEKHKVKKKLVEFPLQCCFMCINHCLKCSETREVKGLKPAKVFIWFQEETSLELFNHWLWTFLCSTTCASSIEISTFLVYRLLSHLSEALLLTFACQMNQNECIYNVLWISYSNQISTLVRFYSIVINRHYLRISGAFIFLRCPWWSIAKLYF